MDPQDYQDYQPNCAVCGRPADGECISGCETHRLNMAIEQAEAQWLKTWRDQTREWVARNAVKYVTQTFSAMKEARLATFATELRTIPYYQIYEQYQGRPPLHPQYVVAIKQQLAQAEYDLRRNINSDWRSCVLRYPEVLTHFFSLVNVTLPKNVEGPSSVMPSVPAFMPPPALTNKTRSTTGSTAQKKARRVSLSVASNKTKENDDQSLETIAKLLNASSFGAASMKPKAGRGSPAFDMTSKAGGKKRMTGDFLLSGKGSSLPRAPTAPPSSQSPWKLPGTF